MKKLLLITIVAMLVSGCASLNLMDTPNVTPEQAQAARCYDAQTGLAIAQVMLPQSFDPDAKAYWTRYLDGAQIAIKAYCLN